LSVPFRFSNPKNCALFSLPHAVSRSQFIYIFNLALQR
jgi:hypothetical protein